MPYLEDTNGTNDGRNEMTYSGKSGTNHRTLNKLNYLQRGQPWELKGVDYVFIVQRYFKFQWTLNINAFYV